MPKDYPTPKKERTSPYWKELNKVIDPDLQIGLVDLGLIYQIKVNKTGNAIIDMTLTSPTCPYAPILIQEVKTKMQIQKDIKNVEIKIIWDPPWTNDLIDPDIKTLLMGI